MHIIEKTNGKFKPKSVEVLKSLPDGKYQIDKKKNKRSNEQNAYLYGVVIPLITKWWNDNKKEDTPLLNHNDIHDWIQARGYWGYKVVGKETIPKRSSDITTIEMMAGFNQLQIDYAKWGLIIPDPNQTDFLDDKNNVQTQDG